MKTMSRCPILLSFLVLSCIKQPANCAQTKTPDPIPSTTAPGKTSATSVGRVFVATLPKAVDVKRLKAGDRLTAVGTGSGGLSSAPITYLGRVVETRALGSGNKDSLLLIRFEKVKHDNNQEVPLRLILRAVVSPLAIRWSISPIIVDSYPCDYEADPKGCDEKTKKHDPESQPTFGGPMAFVCEKNPKKGKGQPADNCIPVSEASGVYGFPDLSVSPYPDGSDLDFAITSIKKSVHLEQGTVLIFSRSGTRLTQTPQP
jgi:hypothetical protein